MYTTMYSGYNQVMCLGNVYFNAPFDDVMLMVKWRAC